MIFAHDVVASMQAAVALVNTAAPPDTLTTLAQLEAFYAEHRYTGQRPTDLEAVRVLREPLRERDHEDSRWRFCTSFTNSRMSRNFR